MEIQYVEGILKIGQIRNVSQLFILSASVENLLYAAQFLLAEPLGCDVDSGQQFAIAVHFSSNRHAFVLDFQHFSVLNVVGLFDIDCVAIQVWQSAFEAQDGFLERDIKSDAEIVAFSAEGGMLDLIKFHVDIAWIKIEALLALSLEQDHITVLHALLQLVLEVTWSDDDLVATTDRALAGGCNTGASTGFTFHLHFLDLVFHFHLSEHLSRALASRTGSLLTTRFTSSFTMLADLTSTETIDHLSASVKFFKRNPLLSSKITSLSQRILFQLLQSGLPMKIISYPFGHVNQDLIGMFDLHILLKDIGLVGIAIRMILD